MKKFLPLIILLNFISYWALSQDIYTSRANGSLEDPNVWNCTGSCSSGIPGNGAIVNIINGHNIAVNSEVLLSEVNLTRRNTLNGASFNLNSDAEVTVTGDINVNDAQSNISIMNGSILRLQGNILNNGGTVIAATGSSVFYTGSSDQIIYPTSYYILTISKTGGTASLTSDLRTRILRINNGTFNKASYNIFLTGDLNINSSIVSTGGALIFEGSSHNITGNYAVNLENIVVDSYVNNNHTGGITISNSITFSGSNRTLDADGGGAGILILSSESETQTAYVGEMTNGNRISGNITLERYIDASVISSGPNEGKSEVWRYLTSPLNGVTVADWENEIAITGPFDGRSDEDECPECNLNSPSLFSYHESREGSLSDGYDYFGFPAGNDPGGSSTTNFERGRGYAIWIRDFDQDNTLDMRGTIESGSFDLPISYTSTDFGTANDGWNLVGNPFLSPIDFDNNGWLWGDDVIQAVYIKDNYGKVVDNADDYLVYNGSVYAGAGSDSWDGVMAIGQAFWIKAEGSDASLTLTQDAKTTLQPQHLFRKSETENEPTHVLRIILNHGEIKDDAVVHFREGASEGMDISMDAPKMFNSNLNISTLLNNDEREMVINSLPFSSMQDQVRLAIHPQNPKGEYTLSFQGHESFDFELKTLLQDSYLNEEIELAPGEAYTFYINDDEASYGKDRFIIKFSELVLGTESDILMSNVKIYPNPTQNTTTVDLHEGTANLLIMSIDGKSVHSQDLAQGQNIINLEKLEKGMYLFRITGESVNYSERIVKY